MTIQELDILLQKEAIENTSTHTDPNASETTLDDDWFIPKNKKIAFQVHPSCFNYSSGQTNIWHRHNFLEMFYVYKGECRQRINDGTIYLQEGDICILDTNVYHAIDVSQRSDIVVNCLFRKSFFDMVFLSQIAENDILSNFLVQTVYQEKKTNSFLGLV